MDTTSKVKTHHPFNLRYWTVFTWLGAFLWLWGPFCHNFIWPPVKFHSIGSDGEILSSGTYSTLAEIPFPLGWPFRYIIPSNPFSGPMMVGAPPVPLGPTSVEWSILGANVVLIVLATLALIYCLQKLLPKFSTMTLLIIATLVGLYFGLVPVISRLLGPNWGMFVSDAVYFSPIVGAILTKIAMKSGFQLSGLRSTIAESSLLKPFRRRELNYDTPDDSLALASQLDQDGRWDDAIDLYRAVAQKWPEQTEYVENCIAAIIVKKSAA